MKFLPILLSVFLYGCTLIGPVPKGVGQLVGVGLQPPTVVVKGFEPTGTIKVFTTTIDGRKVYMFFPEDYAELMGLILKQNAAIKDRDYVILTYEEWSDTVQSLSQQISKELE